jgi:hypothetical protein
MTGNCQDCQRRIKISFGSYIQQLCKIVLSSSLVLGLVLGITFLFIGETTMNVDGDLDFGTFDGFWLILAVPLVSILVFVLLSPLSFLIHRLLSRKDAGNAPRD